MDNHINKVEITHKTIIFTVLFLLGLYFLFLIRDIIILLFVAFLIMAALGPIVNRLERLKIPRVLSIMLVYILLYTFLIGSIALVVPTLIFQINILVSQISIPQSVIDSFDFESFNLQELEIIARQFSSLPKIIGIISSAFSSVLVVVMITVISFYLLIDHKNLHKGLIWMFGNGNADKKAASFVNAIEHQIGDWVRGQAIIMFLVGLLTYIGLQILGIPYALPFAIITGLLEIVPNLGPVLATVPAAAIVFFSISPTMGFITIGLYILIQQLQNYLITPVVMKKSVGINPVVVITTLLIGIRFYGAIGAVLSIPIYLVLKVILIQLYKLKSSPQ